MVKKKKRINKKTRKLLLIVQLLAIGLLIIFGIRFFNIYKQVYKPNVILPDSQAELYIPTGSSLEDVSRILYKQNFITDRNSFEWLAEKKNYSNLIKPGCYIIKDGMSNNDLINLLRSGRQTPVKVMFHNVRSTSQLAGIIAAQLELDSVSLVRLLSNNKFLTEKGFNLQTIPAMFIPNTYEFYWNTDEKAFLTRMYTEYEKFWNKKRKKKAEKIGLTPVEVSTLASIVDEETLFDDELKRVAGTYMNRLQKNMRLQADPTIRFAMGDFTIQRILHKHLAFDSPYNTYKHGGLPPGPITIPSVAAIDAVLDHEDHDYLYFCARDDFSGYHHFSKTLAQHNRYAAKYRMALNRKRIYK
ncbi:MAG: endolytic transglycosylase MltG [Bacteroidota bacterium]